MDCKINWTPESLTTFDANLEYLKLNWTAKEISNFILLVENKIMNLSKHPKLGRAIHSKNKNVRYSIVHKRVLLIYKYKAKSNEIDLLVFWNTYQNPQKLFKKNA